MILQLLFVDICQDKVILKLLFLLSLCTLSLGNMLSLGTVHIDDFYNGTIVIFSNSTSQVFLPTSNFSVISSQGNYHIKGNIITVYNGTVLVLKLNTKNILLFLEPNTTYISLIYPTEYRPYYLSTAPIYYSAKGSLINMTFYTKNLTAVIGLETQDTLQSKLDYSTIVLGLSLLETVIIGLLIYTLYSLKKQKKIEKVHTEEEYEIENINLINGDELTDRDLLILKAIKDGAKTLSEISRMTHLPKSTVHRRLKRLTSLGYIKEARENGKVAYVLLKDSSSGKIS